MSRKNQPRKSKPVKPTRVKRSNLRFVEIVADGSIAVAGYAFGRQLPLFIVDASTMPDVEELIRIHEHVSSGDVRPEWAYMPDEHAVALILNFDRPVETRFSLYLPVQKYGGMIDQILGVGIFLLQSGKPGDRLSNTVDAHRIFVQTSSTRKFREAWEGIFQSVTASYFRSKGRGRRESRELAAEAIERIRALHSFTMPAGNKSSGRGLIIKPD